MKNHYVTFGQVHTHRINGKTLDRDTVAVFQSESAGEGRKKAFELFGDKFFTDYHGEQWKDSNLSYFPKGLVFLDI